MQEIQNSLYEATRETTEQGNRVSVKGSANMKNSDNCSDPCLAGCAVLVQHLLAWGRNGERRQLGCWGLGLQRSRATKGPLLSGGLPPPCCVPKAQIPKPEPAVPFFSLTARAHTHTHRDTHAQTHTHTFLQIQAHLLTTHQVYLGSKEC